VNEIAYEVAPAEYGVGPADGVEPEVDGMSVTDLFKHADGGRAPYASLRRIEATLRSWARTEKERGIRLPGCVCGDPDCSSVPARMVANSETVGRSAFWASSPPSHRREGPDCLVQPAPRTRGPGA
jgi:hypothetical protein